MLVTRAPLVDIAPLEHATMPGRVVVQFDKRDIETMKLIKLDLLGLRMLSAIDDALRDIKADCAVCLDLDRLPEDIDEVFRMICAADTVGVFQIESRAQMQTLPKSRPETLDDLVVEVAIIRPGPIQGDAVHPYLRRRQGIEPVTYLHPALEPILAETLGVILYQEQVMKIAIDVAGFSAADSDGFRRAMGTWRSSKEMEKLHTGFVEGCIRSSGLAPEAAEELFGKVAGFASFGFNKSHAAAFARTAYESAFLKLFYPAQFVTGLINAQPMGFYPVEVLINDAKRHGVAVLPVDVNASRFRTTTEWVGHPRFTAASGRGYRAAAGGRRVVRRGAAGRGGPRPFRGAQRGRLRHPPRAAPGQGHRRSRRGATRCGAGARAVRSARWPTWWRAPELSEEVVERLIRAGVAGFAGAASPRGTVAAARGRRCGAGPERRSFARLTNRPGAAAGHPPAADPGTGTATAERAGAARRCLRHPLARCSAPGHGVVPAGAGVDRCLDALGAGRSTTGAGGHRRSGRHPAAPHDRQGHGLPGARG